MGNGGEGEITAEEANKITESSRMESNSVWRCSAGYSEVTNHLRSQRAEQIRSESEFRYSLHSCYAWMLL